VESCITISVTLSQEEKAGSDDVCLLLPFECDHASEHALWCASITANLILVTTPFVARYGRREIPFSLSGMLVLQAEKVALGVSKSSHVYTLGVRYLE
jgi:hypothetical protein